jgi:putative oxidoreductase
MNEQANVVLSRWGMVPIRVAAAVIFVMHGWQKVSVFGIPGTSEMLRYLGIPLPTFFAVVVMTTELVGGLAIGFGVLARFWSVLLAIDMTVAILVARRHAFFTPIGFEFELVLLGGVLTIAALGSGAISLDRLVKRGSTKAD